MRPVPKWNEYFIDIAETVASRSKDPSTQVGCVIVDDKNHIIGMGYNGFPATMEDRPELWERPTKYDYVVHAEMNALLNCTKSVSKGILFCTLFPCKDCAKLIAASGIKKVCYRDDKLNGRDYLDPISVDIFKRCGITIQQVS